MSICWSCQKNIACERLYLNGEQQICKDRDNAYKSYNNYIKWLAKSKDFYYEMHFIRNDSKTV